MNPANRDRKVPVHTGSSGIPVMAYRVPDLAELKSRPAKRLRKGSKAVLSVVISRRYIEQLRAVADCLGIELRSFAYYALWGKANEEARRQFGLEPEDLLAMTKPERAELAKQYNAVRRNSIFIRETISEN